MSSKQTAKPQPLWIRETFINVDREAQFGESDWYESDSTTLGDLYRALRSEYGACDLIQPVEHLDYEGCSIKVSDLSEVPAKFRGKVAVVTDHGNVSLYVKTSRGLREVWSVV